MEFFLNFLQIFGTIFFGVLALGFYIYLMIMGAIYISEELFWGQDVGIFLAFIWIMLGILVPLSLILAYSNIQ